MVWRGGGDGVEVEGGVGATVWRTGGMEGGRCGGGGGGGGVEWRGGRVRGRRC